MKTDWDETESWRIDDDVTAQLEARTELLTVGKENLNELIVTCLTLDTYDGLKIGGRWEMDYGDVSGAVGPMSAGVVATRFKGSFIDVAKIVLCCRLEP